LQKAGDYRTRVLDDLSKVPAALWNDLARGPGGGPAQPFVRHEFLRALETAGCVGHQSGWVPRHLLVEDPDGQPCAAVPLYLKSHSYGEYVFDWAWADAYRRSGLRYYPKLLSAIPFTPVCGPRLLARDESARVRAARALLELAAGSGLSSLHVLFPNDDDSSALARQGLLTRRGVQFHWRNAGWPDFDAFLASLSQPKRKKIRAERRKVAESALEIERLHGAAIREADWAFFERCYAATYAAHQSTPYLNLAFFDRIAKSLADHLVLVIARRGQQPIASSLLVMDQERLYGRYWGALESVPCLHFELCYYQAIELAIERKLSVIEGGAQGEHKMARGFEPVQTTSLHWLAEPAFADAVERFLAREGIAIGSYIDELDERSPFRPIRNGACPPPGDND
jgi:uncharacterized protein